MVGVEEYVENLEIEVLVEDFVVDLMVGICYNIESSEECLGCLRLVVFLLLRWLLCWVDSLLCSDNEEFFE